MREVWFSGAVRRAALIGVASGQLCSALPALGQVNSWTNPASANWEQPFWSLGVLPNSFQTVEITNAGWKAVAISSSTVQTAPESLTVNRLDIAAPDGAESVLLLNYAGFGRPLQVLDGLTVGDNGKLLCLSSSLQVGAGGVNISNGFVVQDQGSVAVAGTVALDGEYDLTNGVMQSGGLAIGSSRTGIFNQYGGTVQADSTVLRGGSPPFIDIATYNLFGGTLMTTNLEVGGGFGAGQFFQQSGGTNRPGRVRVLAFASPARYELSGGWLRSGSLEVLGGSFNSGVFEQSGGQHVATNGLHLEGGIRAGLLTNPGQYNLSGGELAARLLDLGPYAVWAQSNGTARISESVQFNVGDSFVRLTSHLTGGVLACAEMGSTGIGEDLVQTGGELIVSNTLSFSGAGPFTAAPAIYSLLGGTLSASNIVLQAQMIIGSAGGQQRRIANPGGFTLAGLLQAGDIDEQLGRLILAANASIDLGLGAAKLGFATSSAEIWAPQAILFVLNWDGATNGGGADQLFFGGGAAGLTPSQVRQIQFVNPAGLPSGNYFARLLSTGEVVPVPRPVIFFSRQGSTLELNWEGTFALQASTNVAGPFLTVPGASSPFVVDLMGYPSQFFRLIGN